MSKRSARIVKRIEVPVVNKEKKYDTKVREWDDFFQDFGMKEDEISKIKQLQYPKSFYDPIVFEIGELYTYEGFGRLYERLKKSDKEKSLTFVNQGIMEKENKAFFEIELSSKKGDIDVADGVPCDKCKSKNTTITRQQTRSADEGTSGFRVCLDCGHKKMLG